MRTNKLSQEAIDLIKEHEGFRAKAYDDFRPNHDLQPGEAVRGTLTIGYGHTGPDVTIGQEIDHEHAEALLWIDLQEAEDGVAALVSVPITDREYGALVSWIYNIGRGNAARSTAIKRLNAGMPRASVAEAMTWWNRSKGRILTGLVRRREAERALFLKQDAASV